MIHSFYSDAVYCRFLFVCTFLYRRDAPMMLKRIKTFRYLVGTLFDSFFKFHSTFLRKNNQKKLIEIVDIFVLDVSNRCSFKSSKCKTNLDVYNIYHCFQIQNNIKTLPKYLSVSNALKPIATVPTFF